MIGKRLINTGVAAADALVPSENFNTVLYTGNGGTQRIGGYINRGAEFNGSSSEISIPSTDTTPIDFSTEDWSMSWWIYLNTLGDNKRIISKWGSSPGVVILFRTKSNGAIEFIERDGTTSYSQSAASGTISAGQWYHMTYTRSGTEAKFYLDGSLNKTMTRTNAINQGGTEPIYIGRSSSGINGKFDQVRFFNKELSSSEVTTLYGETHSSTTISTTDIFNDNSGVALYQLDGNANDTGGVSGKFGSAAIFNGSSSVINLNNNFNLANNSFSISFWTANNGTGDSFPIGVVSGSTQNNVLLIGKPSWSTKLDFSFYANDLLSSTDMATDGTWQHWVCTYDASTNARKIYLNGTLDNSDTSASDYLGTANLQLGKSAHSSTYYNGKIDDVRIYSDVLTSTEVGYLYNNTTASIPTDNLEAYYKLDGDARDEQQLYDGTATNVTYAYDGTATNVTYQEATKFQPDLLWIKNRDSASYNHKVFDSVRGADKALFSNLTSAEYDGGGAGAGYMGSFDSNGFTLNSGNANTNASSTNYVAWCFKGGGPDVLNENGSINSQVSANQDAGFSIVEWTGNGTSGQSIGHGLSQAPEMIIQKRTSIAGDWECYHKDIGATKKILLNSTAAATTSSAFGSTAPTDSVSYAGAYTNTLINYYFHSVDGYSKIGSYTGTGAAGNSIVTGFEPAFVMIKCSSSANGWIIWDNDRGGDKSLFPHSSTSEVSSTYDIDFNSNGFTIQSTNTPENASGQTYIYLAIAADPDTTTPTVENSFDVVTWTGNGSSQDIETDFKPDLVWTHWRNSQTARNSCIYDSVRGATNLLSSQTTGGQGSISNSLTSFNNNGFSMGSWVGNNESGSNWVAWCWKAGDHDDNLPQINTEGSIDSVVSVNADAGFSIVKYTGNSGSTQTIGHGLSSAPEMIIVKNISDGAQLWSVYHSSTGSGQVGHLNLTNAFSASGDWGSTTPTSTVFTIGSTDGRTNSSGGENHIAYCFHSVTGYQKVGSYTGTGATGNVINVGFKPRFLLWKKTNGAVGWFLLDGIRNTTDVWSARLEAHTNNAESGPDAYTVTVSDTGFEMTGSFANWTGSNELNSTYIYLAIK